MVVRSGTKGRLRGIVAAVALGLAAALVAFPGAGISVARACGGFLLRTVSPERRPSLAREKVLIVYDADEQKQHFIREVAFRAANETFGFVVTTPTRPSVDKVERTPFSKLRRILPFRPPTPEEKKANAWRNGRGAGSGFGGGVSVLETKKVGSFTAFVLSATDEKALAGWLKDNELVSTKETDAWLAHYVRMGFFYIAMRYDPPRGAPKDAAPDAGPVKAETIRISFATPVPYYPYLEPEAPKTGEEPRLMELWYVAKQSVVPVALHDVGGKRRWVRPLQPGHVYERERRKIEVSLGDTLAPLLPEGDIVLQTFQDQKRSRTGFGDILFAARDAHDLTAEQTTALQPLLGILDPELTAGGK